MQPRGQLWFELQRVCKDFREFSGLGQKEALEVMVTVLGNLLRDTQTERERLKSAGDAGAAGPTRASAS